MCTIEPLSEVSYRKHLLKRKKGLMNVSPGPKLCHPREGKNSDVRAREESEIKHHHHKAVNGLILAKDFIPASQRKQI